jgi:aspartyl-tRNA(Asn)/glutamyl-tRNA(Gln) amidotransferase subunit C
MQVDDTLLKKLEKLSYLKISDDKRDGIISELSEILNFVDNLNELDTEGVDGNFAMNDKETFLREDIASCDTQINENILKNAPRSEDHFFVVPKIIE